MHIVGVTALLTVFGEFTAAYKQSCAEKLFVSPCWVGLKVAVRSLMIPETMQLKCVPGETGNRLSFVVA